jgi:hypothetical protein
LVTDRTQIIGSIVELLIVAMQATSVAEKRVELGEMGAVMALTLSISATRAALSNSRA